MYRKHFGLNDKPFNLIPDPDYLYLSPKHRVALSLLEYALMETAAGLSVISGEVGSGKTTLIRKLMRRIDHELLTVGVINNTNTFEDELMSWVASSFGLDHEGKDKIRVFRDFQKFLIDEYASGKRTVLIVDEAQNLGGGALEELRMLTNINADRDQLLQILLVGQPELLDTLRLKEYAQIAQRVSVEFHLEPLEYSEVKNYVSHRMEVAGATKEIFSEDALRAIYYFSGGVPRLINTLCDYALVHGYALEKQTIEMDTILEVRKNRKIGGINNFVLGDEAIESTRKQIFDKTGIDLANIA